MKMTACGCRSVALNPSIHHSSRGRSSLGQSVHREKVVLRRQISKGLQSGRRALDVRARGNSLGHGKPVASVQGTEREEAKSQQPSHLDVLERLTSESGRTISEQLQRQVDESSEAEEVTVPLAQNVPLDASSLTIHQKRNIRRQKYLDEVAKRDDAPFFTTVALFVVLPPVVILGVAVATGYVQLFP